jgi:endonuclease/exonuclease/phosphatase family metal-dependent hydrolase
MLTEKIRAATYNTGLLKILFRDFVPFVSSRAKTLPKVLSKFVEAIKLDIIFLQEVWNKSASYCITSSLIEQNFTVLKPQVGGFLGSGLILAVRNSFRIIRSSFIPYLSSASADRFAVKGAFSLTLGTPGGAYFTLIGTHMQSLATKNGQPLKSGEVFAHRQQVQQLQAIIKHESGRGLPTLVLGDFNVGPHYAEENFYHLLKTCELKEAYLDWKPSAYEHTWDVDNPLVQHGWNALEPSALIDHCFIRSGEQHDWKVMSGGIIMKETYNCDDSAESRLIPLSDHYGLVVDLVLGH